MDPLENRSYKIKKISTLHKETKKNDNNLLQTLKLVKDFAMKKVVRSGCNHVTNGILLTFPPFHSKGLIPMPLPPLKSVNSGASRTIVSPNMTV